MGERSEGHDTDNETANCQLDEIASDHLNRYHTLAKAKSDNAYDDCSYCLGGSTRWRSGSLLRSPEAVRCA